jgi:MoxR-like ATPase
VSPRGAIALVRVAQARAVFEGRDFVIPDDIHAEIHPTWSHRIQTADTVDSAHVVDNALDEVPIE